MSDAYLKSRKEATCSSNTRICVAWFFEVKLGRHGGGIKGQRNEQQSDRAENHDQNGSYLGRIEVEKVKFLM